MHVEAPNATATGLDPTPLLDPGSVAVVGANDRAGSYADTVLRNLERAGFEGPVWGVNPRRDRVHGRECVPTVRDLPEPVDAVVVAVPAPAVPGVLGDAIARGCGGAVVISAGFGEVASGRELEGELRRVALGGSLPVCGPNGNGILSAAARAPIWGDSVPPLEPGGVAMVTQSGNVGVNAVGSRRGIGWHTVVSTGNQAVLQASDWLAAITGLDGVRSVALFLEADGEGDRLADALALCAERGVGVAVLKVGASVAGVAAATAHTGALAGDQRLFRALIEEAGGAWARDPHELLELTKAMAEPRARPRGDGGLAVLTCSGGDSGVAADQAERLGLSLPRLSGATRSELRRLLPKAATVANPLDYTAMIWGDTDLLQRIVAAVASDRAIDQLLLLYDHPRGLSAEAEATWAAVRAGLIAGAGEGEAAALVASTLPDLLDDQAAREFASQGVPAIAGLQTALRVARAMRRPRGDAERLRAIGAAARGVRAYGGDALDEAAAKALLAGAGVRVPPGRLVLSPAEAVAAAAALGEPVAVKLCSPRLRHKSDAGALLLGVSGAEEVAAAYERVSSAVPGAPVLVERMVSGPGVELIVGAGTAGVVPALTVGIGGVWTEVLDDVVTTPLPASPERVEAAIRSLRGAGLLTGARGGPSLDVAGAAKTAALIGELLLRSDFAVLEVNPLLVQRSGCTALDALAA